MVFRTEWAARFSLFCCTAGFLAQHLGVGVPPPCLLTQRPDLDAHVRLPFLRQLPDMCCRQRCPHRCRQRTSNTTSCCLTNMPSLLVVSETWAYYFALAELFHYYCAQRVIFLSLPRFCVIFMASELNIPYFIKLQIAYIEFFFDIDTQELSRQISDVESSCNQFILNPFTLAEVLSSDSSQQFSHIIHAVPLPAGWMI